MEDDQRPTAAAELRVELQPVAMSLSAGTTVEVVLDTTFSSAGQLAMSEGAGQ